MNSTRPVEQQNAPHEGEPYNGPFSRARNQYPRFIGCSTPLRGLLRFPLCALLRFAVGDPEWVWEQIRCDQLPWPIVHGSSHQIADPFREFSDDAAVFVAVMHDNVTESLLSVPCHFGCGVFEASRARPSARRANSFACHNQARRCAGVSSRQARLCARSCAAHPALLVTIVALRTERL